MPDGTVIVAGSGKESFKTFNVSTAASILAAAAGAKVVKGVSRSVSAVSGAADVLDALGVVATGRPEHVAELTEQVGIAFVSYAAFCPSYAGRYDGVFRDLSPFSFFMPSSVASSRRSRLHPSRQRRLTPLLSGVGRGRRMYGVGGTQRGADRPGGSSRDV